jgi:predicted ATPase/DNA-binding CsgD family transcriptional regulator
MRNGDISLDEVQADNLTWREQEVLTLLADRLTNREIGDQLHLAESTVKDYVGRILSKLYVKNRRQAVERAKALGLLGEDREAAPTPTTILPAEPTPFVGRRDELTEIIQLLGSTRLLTLTGPGGIGKTRLALKTAKGAADGFKDGIFFIALAPIQSEKHITQTIAETLKFPLATQEDPKQQLLRYLQNKQLLLVMDNFEHLLAGAGIASEILAASPGVKILATSRERLNLLPETSLTVEGMGFPSKVESEEFTNNDGMLLFVQSANRVCPGFDPSPEDMKQIAKLCQTVQGTPLAIELAAAWLQILTIEEIDVELQKGFDILVSEKRDIAERHRSIRAVFDHSWSLLPPSEQEIFKHISVFRGGFTREAAEQVAGATLQQLVGLVNKSFLSHDQNSGRLEVHELLRQYAQEKLEGMPEEYGSAIEDHAAYYARFMKQRWGEYKGSRQLRALAEIEADIENIRAAWRYYLDQINAQQMWSFVNALWQVYWIRGWNLAGMELFTEAANVLKGVVDEESVALRALVKAFQGYFMAFLGYDHGYPLVEESVSVLEQLHYPEALVFAYDSLMLNAYFFNRYPVLIEISKKMLEISEEIGDQWLIAFSLFAASMSALLEEDYPEARRLAIFNLNLNEEIGDVIGSTEPLIILGHVALANGELEDARRYYLQCLKISKRIGFHYGIQTSTKYLGKVAISMGNIAEAEKYLLQCMQITNEVGFIRDVVNLLYEFARLRVAQGKVEQAVELLGVVLPHPASHSHRMLEGRIRDSAKDLLADLEAEISPQEYSAALERSQHLALDQIVIDLVASKS